MQKYINKYFSLFGSIGGTIALGITLIGAFLLYSWITQIAWNHVIPQIFNLPYITFNQSMWVVLLSSCLFKDYTTNNKKD